MGGGPKPDGGWWQGEDTLRPVDAAAPAARARRPRRLLVLVGVLIFHGFGALTWFAFLGFSSDAGTDRQLSEALRFGAGTWLVASLLITWLWWSRRSPWFWAVPVAWWFPSFLLMIAVVYGWNSSVGGAQDEVGAHATFAESGDCLLRYANALAGREFSVKLDNDRVARCFPKQTTMKKKALIVCFNTYERNHPGHAGWPEENMRGCAWDGRAAVRAPFAFGKVVAVPAVPRAGRDFLLKIGVTGSGSAAYVNKALDTGTLAPIVTVDGYNDDVPRDVTLELDPDGTINLNFTVPTKSEGRRLTIELTTPPGMETLVRKTMTFTVAR